MKNDKVRIPEKYRIWTILPGFHKCNFPEAWLQNISMDYVSQKYAFDRKSNFQMLWLLKTEMSFINEVALAIK